MTDSPERPIAESYWVIPGKLLAGEFPGRYDATLTRQRLNSFLRLGVDSYLDLTQARELPSYEPLLYEQARICGLEVTYARFPIRDRGVPSIKTMTAILDSLDASLEAGRVVYLHCWGGVGRTGTVVGCHLVRRGLTGEQALSQLEEWWRESPKRLTHPRAPETDQQVRFILNWKG